MKPTKCQPALPIAHTARIAFELDTLRARCSEAAQILLSEQPVEEAELEECARLDEALARAHAVLKSIIAQVLLSRIRRRSRRSRTK